jgi:hypothetical protein
VVRGRSDEKDLETTLFQWEVINMFSISTWLGEDVMKRSIMATWPENEAVKCF